MRLKNEIFAAAVDWLVKNRKVDGQKGLAQFTGISANTISRIMTGKVEPSDDTLRKLSDKFGFNMQWLRGIDPHHMLIEDVAEEKMTQQQQPSANDDMLELYAQRIRLVDDMRVTLKAELEEVREIRDELKKARDDFRDATYRLTQYINRLNNNQTVGIAAEQ